MIEQDLNTVRERLREIVSHGLVTGMGEPRPGALCIESAICLAAGEPHGDAPSCVAKPDRAYAIGLNDAAWSSPQTRAEALLPLGLAQLGTVGTDRTSWVRRVVQGTIRRVLSGALRAAADVIPEHAGALRAAADRCERDGDRAAASNAYAAASNAYAAASNAAAYAAAAAAADAAYAAADAAHASNAAANAAAANAAAAYAAYAAADAAHASNAAANATAAHAAANAAASARAASRDRVLRVAVRVALDAYQ